jgi:hypothetical protein
MRRRQGLGAFLRVVRLVTLFSMVTLCSSVCGCAQGSKAKEKFWSFNDDFYKWLMDIKDEPEPPGGGTPS